MKISAMEEVLVQLRARRRSPQAKSAQAASKTRRRGVDFSAGSGRA